MRALRPYQAESVDAINALTAAGQKALLIAPTGTGKTFMGSTLALQRVERGMRGVWMAPRRELISQAIEALGEMVCGGLAPGFMRDRSAPIQVCTIQTLLAIPPWDRPKADFVVPDEAHHMMAATWRQLLDETYASAEVIGLTATPERGDGAPLGDMFDAFHVACTYPFAIENGFLVPCRVYHSRESVNGFAIDPLEAYRRFGNDETGFVFCSSEQDARELAEHFTAEGVPSEAVSYRTKKLDRKQAIERLRSGETRLLMNVNALTEGVDVPSASVCLLARKYGHKTALIQSVGRVMRPSEGKLWGRLIDLPGNVLTHSWMPGDHIDYSLVGDGGIVTTSERSLSTCMGCGCVFASAPKCPACGQTRKQTERKLPRIYNKEMEEVFNFEHTPQYAKQMEFDTLISMGKNWTWVKRQYKELFGEKPPMPGEKFRRKEYDSYRAQELAGRPRGSAVARYIKEFGSKPPWSWNETEIVPEPPKPTLVAPRPQSGWSELGW